MFSFIKQMAFALTVQEVLAVRVKPMLGQDGPPQYDETSCRERPLPSTTEAKFDEGWLSRGLVRGLGSLVGPSKRGKNLTKPPPQEGHVLPDVLEKAKQIEEYVPPVQEPDFPANPYANPY